MNGTVLQEAKEVQENKVEAIRLAELSKTRNLQKKAELYQRRKTVYLDFAPKIQEKKDPYLKKFTAGILNDVFVFMGGKTKDLVTKNKDGVMEGIRNLPFYILTS